LILSQTTTESGGYRSQLAGLLSSEQRRLIVSIDAIRQYDRAYAKE
jgi:DNA replication licensing factor MCM3